MAEDCTLLRLDRPAFHDLTEDYPAMLREMCKLLAANLREANRGLAGAAPPSPSRKGEPRHPAGGRVFRLRMSASPQPPTAACA